MEADEGTGQSAWVRRDHVGGAEQYQLAASPATTARDLYFFFQAEDGIRDHCVTGVQTCALPISPTPARLTAPSGFRPGIDICSQRLASLIGVCSVRAASTSARPPGGVRKKASLKSRTPRR